MGNPLPLALLFTLAAGAQVLYQRPTPNHPQWSVHVVSGKGESYIDQPSCHPLDYFLKDPVRFDYGSDLYGKKSGEIKDKAESQNIGSISGFNVRQITHNINDGELVMKMILVERKTGELCEIYHQQQAAAIITVQPAYSVKVGDETVLVTSDPVSGTGGFSAEEYWTFDQDGPIELGVWGKIDEVQEKVLPAGRSVMKGGGFDLRTLTYSAPVWKEGDPNCCPTGGGIEMKFALKNHRLTVVSQSFTPN